MKITQGLPARACLSALLFSVLWSCSCFVSAPAVRAAETYTLTVNSGKGSGSYAAGTYVQIMANAAPSGQSFVKWTGDTAGLASATSEVVTMVMPAADAAVTATYSGGGTPDPGTTTYKLTVVSGTGSGNYASGTKVTISAAAPATGQVFDKWTGSISSIASATASTTTVNMPASAITLTATYKAATATKYSLSVTSGTGTGSYTAGTDVPIRANTAPSGMVFDKWTGDLNYVFDPALASTKVTVPAKNIELTATYKYKVTAYPNGTLLKISASPKVYVLIDGKKKWISTPEVFEQLGYKWTAIKIIAATELAAYPDYEDNLIRQIGDEKVYLVVNGVKRHIPNPAVFLSYGFSWDDVKVAGSSVVEGYRNTYLIKASKTTAVYYLRDGVRHLIPSAEIFNSYGDKWEDVQIISAYEMSVYPNSNLIRLTGTQQVNLLQDNAKRLIPSAEIFDKYHYNWNEIIDVNAAEFNYYKRGSDVK
jgi:hypothetical protein